MKIIHSIIITFATCGIAFAEVNTVKDNSVSPNVMMVKLIDKKPVYQDIEKAAAKKVCTRTTAPVTYMRSGMIGETRIFRVAPMNTEKEFYCYKVSEPVMVKALIGYQVTYEFRGTIMHDFLNYEPGDYVQVYSGK